DIPVLASQADKGIVHPPRYIPEIFRDLNGLAIWLGVSTFWSRLKNQAILEHYERLFREL
ncbi:MAG TPA: flavohemoglobin expression-modulating QEGLA motif protein, partial [Polyangiaceae bacterium]